jgi:hypothetical protein
MHAALEGSKRAQGGRHTNDDILALVEGPRRSTGHQASPVPVGREELTRLFEKSMVLW